MFLCIQMDSETLTDILLCNEVTNPYYGAVMACDSLPTFDINGEKYYILTLKNKFAYNQSLDCPVFPLWKK